MERLIHSQLSLAQTILYKLSSRPSPPKNSDHTHTFLLRIIICFSNMWSNHYLVQRSCDIRNRNVYSILHIMDLSWYRRPYMASH